MCAIRTATGSLIGRTTRRGHVDTTRVIVIYLPHPPKISGIIRKRFVEGSAAILDEKSR